MIVSRAWGTDPATLRQVTKAEFDAMVVVLGEEYAAQARAAARGD